jgi:endoglucanase
MKRVKEVVDGLLAEQLGVVFDVHHYDALIAAPETHLARFVTIWDQIGQAFSSYPRQVAFELLNEPNGKIDVTWNAIAREALAAIRKSNPDRFVIIQAPNWARTDSLERSTAAFGRAIELPTTDPNLIAGVHLYEPILFTFQGDPYMGAQFSTVGIQFPGPPAQPLVAASTVPTSDEWVKSWLLEYSLRAPQDNPAGTTTIEKAVRQIQEFRARTGIPVYVSEWGSNDVADPSSRLNFTIAMRNAFAKHDVGWAYWDNGGNMRLWDRVSNQWVEPLTTELLANGTVPSGVEH